MIDAIVGIYAPLLGLLGRLLVWPIGVLAVLFKWLSQALYWFHQLTDEIFTDWIDK